MHKNRTLNLWRVPSVHTYVKWRGIRGFVHLQDVSPVVLLNVLGCRLTY